MPRSRKAGLAWLKRKLPKSSIAQSPDGRLLILPDDVDVCIRRIGKTDLMTLRYVETFHHVPESILDAVMLATVAGLRKAMKRWPGRMVCKRIGKRRVEISGETVMATVGDAMMGEFLMWSNLGRMTLSDFLLKLIFRNLGTGRKR